MNYQKVTKNDWKKAIILIIGFVIIVVSTAIIFASHNWPLGFVIWLLIVGGCLFILVSWHTKNYGYKCLSCGHEFEISVLQDLISPHGMGKGGWKYLKCPKCHQRSKATVLKKSGNKNL